MSTSTITNTIKDPTGAVLAGVTVDIWLQASGVVSGGFRVSDGSEVAPFKTTTTNGSGVWSVALEQNANITPTGTYYVAVERLSGVQGKPRAWAFLVGATNQRLQQALISTPPGVTPPTTASLLLTGNNEYTGINQFDGNVIFKSGPQVDPRAFGALGDGIHDDSAAFNAAIAWAAVAGGWGGKLVPSPGNYYIAQTIGPFTNSATPLKGFEFIVPGGVRIFTDQAIPLITVGPGYSGQEPVNCRIDGKGTLDGTGVATAGILTNGTNNLEIGGVRIINIKGGLGAGVELSLGSLGDFAISIDGAKISACKWGVYGHGDNNGLEISKKTYISMCTSGGVMVDGDGTSGTVRVTIDAYIEFCANFAVGLNKGTTEVDIGVYCELATPASSEAGAPTAELSTDRFVKIGMAAAAASDPPSQIRISGSYAVGQGTNIATNPIEVVNGAKYLTVDLNQFGKMAASAKQVVLPGSATAAMQATWRIGSNQVMANVTTVTPQAAAGAGATATVLGDDVAGIITLTTGTGSGAGVLVILTLGQQLAIKPRFALTGDSTHTNPPGFPFAFSPDTQNIYIQFNNAPADGTVYDIHYVRL